MDIIRKIQYLLFCLLVIGFVACDDDDDEVSPWIGTCKIMKKFLHNWQRK